MLSWTPKVVRESSKSPKGRDVSTIKMLYLAYTSIASTRSSMYQGNGNQFVMYTLLKVIRHPMGRCFSQLSLIPTTHCDSVGDSTFFVQCGILYREFECRIIFHREYLGICLIQVHLIWTKL